MRFILQLSPAGAPTPSTSTQNLICASASAPTRSLQATMADAGQKKRKRDSGNEDGTTKAAKDKPPASASRELIGIPNQQTD
jgi:hypothetical protein